MKIAIFTDNFLPGVGGTENAVNSFAEELAKDNDVLVVAPNFHRPFDDSLFSYKVVRVKSLALTKNDNCSFPKLDRNIKRTLEEFCPDIIQTKTLGPISRFACKYATKNKIPLVSTIHTKYRFCYRRAIHLRWLSEIIIRRFARPVNRANCVCTISQDMVREIKSYGIKNDALVIKNGGISRSNAFEKKENARFTFLFVGLVVKYKNLKFSLDALKKVKERGKDFIFNIVGDGADRKYFEKYAKKIGLADNVKFLGRITDTEQLDRIYGQADLFLLPSVFDNDPLVVCESGNMATPSLVIENAGASERLIDNQNGFIEKYDIDSYANRIISIMENEKLLSYVGANARRLFTSWQDTIEKYIEIYQSLLKDNEVKNGNI